MTLSNMSTRVAVFMSVFFFGFQGLSQAVIEGPASTSGNTCDAEIQKLIPNIDAYFDSNKIEALASIRELLDTTAYRQYEQISDTTANKIIDAIDARSKIEVESLGDNGDSYEILLNAMLVLGAFEPSTVSHTAFERGHQQLVILVKAIVANKALPAQKHSDLVRHGLIQIGSKIQPPGPVPYTLANLRDVFNASTDPDFRPTFRQMYYDRMNSKVQWVARGEASELEGFVVEVHADLARSINSPPSGFFDQEESVGIVNGIGFLMELVSIGDPNWLARYVLPLFRSIAQLAKLPSATISVQPSQYTVVLEQSLLRALHVIPVDRKAELFDVFRDRGYLDIVSQQTISTLANDEIYECVTSQMEAGKAGSDFTKSVLKCFPTDQIELFSRLRQDTLKLMAIVQPQEMVDRARAAFMVSQTIRPGSLSGSSDSNDTKKLAAIISRVYVEAVSALPDPSIVDSESNIELATYAFGGVDWCGGLPVSRRWIPAAIRFLDAKDGRYNLIESRCGNCGSPTSDRTLSHYSVVTWLERVALATFDRISISGDLTEAAAFQEELGQMIRAVGDAYLLAKDDRGSVLFNVHDHGRTDMGESLNTLRTIEDTLARRLQEAQKR